MQTIRNDDGTVTVRIPQAPETYDATDGQLYVSETLSAADYAKAAKLPTKRPAAKKKAAKGK